MSLLQITIRNVISIFAGLFLMAIGLRLVFKLMDLPAANSGVGYIYTVSDRMVAPLNNILPLPVITLSGKHVLDTAAFIALLLYALIASLILSMFARLWRTTGSRD